MIPQLNNLSGSAPKISLVVPCYNEEDGLRNMVYRLLETMHINQVPVEIVLVNNGSLDGTGAEIDALLQEGYPIRKVTVEVNQGYGYGVLRGLEGCRGEYVGFLCADDQVDAVDIARLCRMAMRSPSRRLYKVCRRFRMESMTRRIVSSIYNLLVNILFGNLHSFDLNGNPKLFPRASYEVMKLQSKDWFLDAEVMIKAMRLQLPVFELNVFSQMRAEGTSNVKTSTCLEFLKNLAYYRWGQGKHLLDIGSTEAAAQKQGSKEVGSERNVS